MRCRALFTHVKTQNVLSYIDVGNLEINSKENLEWLP